MARRIKAVGHRGSWFAEVDGELLPCVHKHWWTGKHYRDPNARPGVAQWDELIDAIRGKKRVILTNDTVLDGGSGFERTGYIAVYEIADFELGETFIRFRFVRRIVELA